MKKVLALLIVIAFNALAFAQGQQKPFREFIRVDSKMVVLKNVRLIDGTGAAPVEDQTIVLIGDMIGSIGPSASTPVPAGAEVLDLKGYTVMPGLVGMHNHLFFPMGGTPPIYSDMAISFPRLYLALRLQRSNDRQRDAVHRSRGQTADRQRAHDRAEGPRDRSVPGRKGFVHASYARTRRSRRCAKMVNYWADMGATSFKAYMNISRDELAAVVEEAHKRKLKVTGHLCSVTYKEAAEIGIDNLEHGLMASTDFVADKKPDQCPQGGTASLLNLDVNSAQTQETIKKLVEKKVAITSTLPVFEASADRPKRYRIRGRS